ncbi:MAG: hypothetical protein J0M26_17140 [Planctomycetes bacterium]|nr:hypothetical protein [Planctomycetota bacterium]
MPRFLVSFDDGSMDHISVEDLPDVSDAAHAVVREAKAAGVWIFGGGIHRQKSSLVSMEGIVSHGPFPENKAVIGGFCIIEVTSHADALTWGAKFAKACRCTQEIREIMYDPESR